MSQESSSIQLQRRIFFENLSCPPPPVVTWLDKWWPARPRLYKLLPHRARRVLTQCGDVSVWWRSGRSCPSKPAPCHQFCPGWVERNLNGWFNGIMSAIKQRGQGRLAPFNAPFTILAGPSKYPAAQPCEPDPTSEVPRHNNKKASPWAVCHWTCVL